MELGHILLRSTPSKAASTVAALQRCCSKSTFSSRHNPQISTLPNMFTVEPQFQQQQMNPVPQCYQALDFRKKVAVCDRGGSLRYDDLLSRSLDLARSIHDLLPTPHQSVAFLCPNQSSFLLSKWAIWLSGHAAVPLNPTWSEAELEHALHDSGSALILAHESLIDKVFDLAERSGKGLMCLDRSWTQKGTEGESNVLVDPQFIFEKEMFESAKKSPALILYTKQKGVIKTARFNHSQLNAQAWSMRSAWDLTEKSSLLHALPLDHTFSIVSCMMAPLSTGGKVVLHPNFDTIKIWSHLLGIPVKSSEPLPKINLFPSLPSHFHQLLDRYHQLFTTPKTKNFVRKTLKKRLRVMAVTGGPLAKDFRKQWKAASGHEILNCYSALNTGSVLSAALGKDDAYLMQAVPGVQTRVVSKGVVQDENCRSSSACIGELLIKGEQAERDEWVATGDTVKMAKGRFELLGKKK